MSRPRVSVLLAVHNGSTFLEDALNSVLNQTFQDFELLIMDDGSSDATAHYLRDLSRNDPRIRRFEQRKAQGQGVVFNRLLSLAQGDYIAVLDADDIAAPSRLAKQAAYLDAHPDIGLVGSWVEVIDASGAKRALWKLPTEPAHIQWRLLLSCPLVHSATMVRKHLLVEAGGYPTQAVAKDFGLWLKLADISKLANLPEPLAYYRLHDTNLSREKAQEQVQWTIQTVKPGIEALLNQRVPEATVEALYRWGNTANYTDNRRAVWLLYQITRRFFTQKAVPPRARIAISQDFLYRALFMTVLQLALPAIRHPAIAPQLARFRFLPLHTWSVPSLWRFLRDEMKGFTHA